MADYRDAITLDAPIHIVREKCRKALKEMDLRPKEGNGPTLLYHERYRFDLYNPVEVELDIAENGKGIEVDLKATNSGKGPFQESYVRSKIMELMDRIEVNVEREERSDLLGDTGSIASELEMLSRLHSRGLLTDHEFLTAKKRLLG